MIGVVHPPLIKYYLRYKFEPSLYTYLRWEEYTMFKFMRRENARDKFLSLGFIVDESPPPGHIVYKRDHHMPFKLTSKVTEVIEFLKDEHGEWRCKTYRDFNLKYIGVKHIKSKPVEYCISEDFTLFTPPDEMTFEAMCMQLHELLRQDKRKKGFLCLNGKRR